MQPFSHLELKILNRTGGPVFIAAFVPVRLLRELYPLAVGDRVLIRGELGFSRSDKLPHGGQHIIVASALEKLEAGGRVVPEAPPPPVEPHPYGAAIARPLPAGGSTRMRMPMRPRPRTWARPPAPYSARAREVGSAGGTKVRNTWWSQRTDWETVCKRNRGRARYNSLRRLRARLRQREVLQLLAQWGWKPGVQSLIAAHLNVHRSTICRDLQALMPLYRECPHCHQLWPREGWWEAD